ncbi:MAG TPA: quinoprotein dehydrogenase-associated putative ABC transporter substrate-binding protein [Usitatibacter sp.]|nr:quinoprotein dehydrogenase-associated putative ABC transporter substrate-binding protein [Usitatibacter sp.]
MSSAFRRRALLLLLVLAAASAAASGRELRVCGDPDNLPLSHADGSGFENRIAELIAAEMGAVLRYEWQPLRRGFVRKTAGAGLCDVFIGVPKAFERVLTTRPYYRSSYVFVLGPRARGIQGFDDPRLATLRIGVQLPGDDLAATPPGHALTRHGHVDNVRGFTLYGVGTVQQRMLAALESGDIDAALLWGPQAGALVKASRALELRIAAAPPDLEGIPFEYAIAVGVRRGASALRDEIDAVLDRRRRDIDAILERHAVPRTDHQPATSR